MYVKRDICLTAVSACSSDPCQNGGTCVTVSSTYYECQYATGYAGTNCEMGEFRLFLI